MNVAYVARVLLKRWLFTLIGVVLAIGGAVAAMVVVGPVYENKATVLLLPPKSNLANGENPYLGLDGLGPMVDVLIRTMTSQRVAENIAQSWPSAEFTVQKDIATSGPIFIITVDAGSQAEAQAVTKSIVELVPGALDGLQSGLEVRPTSRITSSVLTTYDVPETVRSGQLRAGLGVAGAGLVATTLVVAYIDRRLIDRAARRRSRLASLEALGGGLDSAAGGSSPDDADKGPASTAQVSGKRASSAGDRLSDGEGSSRAERPQRALVDQRR